MAVSLFQSVFHHHENTEENKRRGHKINLVGKYACITVPVTHKEKSILSYKLSLDL